MYKLLLVDFDGVLRIWRQEHTARAEEIAGLPTGTLHQIAFEPSLLHLAVTGRISHEQWLHRIVECVEQTFPTADAETAVRLWAEPVGEIDKEVLTLIRACRKSVPTYLISNATSRLPDDLKTLDLDGEFDVVINSSDIGFCKPQSEIFQHALNMANVKAHEAFFVDDSQQHIVAARAFGLPAFHYQNARELAAELRKVGVLGLIY